MQVIKKIIILPLLYLVIGCKKNSNLKVKDINEKDSVKNQNLKKQLIIQKSDMILLYLDRISVMQ
jgi:hypothetical protein